MAKKKQEQDPYFVRVMGSDMLRVSLLESSKLTLHALQSYYKVVAIRKKKKKALDQLKSEVKELVLLLSKLDGLLPYQQMVEESLKASQAKSGNYKPRRVPKNAEKEVVGKDVTTSFGEIDKLNRSLASIEDKLNRLA